jgi:hypothetical protein
MNTYNMEDLKMARKKPTKKASRKKPTKKKKR